MPGCCASHGVCGLRPLVSVVLTRAWLRLDHHRLHQQFDPVDRRLALQQAIACTNDEYRWADSRPLLQTERLFSRVIGIGLHAVTWCMNDRHTAGSQLGGDLFDARNEFCTASHGIQL